MTNNEHESNGVRCYLERVRDPPGARWPESGPRRQAKAKAALENCRCPHLQAKLCSRYVFWTRS